MLMYASAASIRHRVMVGGLHQLLDGGLHQLLDGGQHPVMVDGPHPVTDGFVFLFKRSMH